MAPPPVRAARLTLTALPLFILALWAGLLFWLARTLDHLRPALAVLDPAATLIWLTLGPMTLYLAQALFYCPPKRAGRPVFIRPRLFSGPLAFLPAPPRPGLETGPAFQAAATPGDQARLLAESEDRLRRHSGLALRLSLLLEAASPLDLALEALSGRLWLPLALPVRLFNLLMSPTRQLTRLGGYLCFLAWRAWDDPAPASDLLVYKRRLALDLHRRDPAGDDEDGAAALNRLTRLREKLRTYGQPGYGARLGEPWPEPAAAEPAAIEAAPWLHPRYRGVFWGLPVTLYASSLAELYHPGRPENDLSRFYPPELALEVETAAETEAAANMAARLNRGRRRLAWLDGRLLTDWQLAARRLDMEDARRHTLKRIAIHHARCRAAHLTAAERLGQGWPEALCALGGLLRLAEHGRRNLSLARENLNRAAAGPRPPAEARAFYDVWADLRGRLAALDLAPALEVRSNLGQAPAIPPPAKDNWRQWRAALEPADRLLDGALAALKDKALAALLAAEEQVARAAAEGGPVPAAPTVRLTEAYEIEAAPERPAELPPRVYYPAASLKLGPGRSLLAALTLVLLNWQGLTQGLSQVIIYNGLELPVTVAVDGGEPAAVPPAGHLALRLRPGREYEFSAAAGRRPLEKFRRRLAPRPGTEVYNVAGAAPLMEWWFPKAEQPGGGLEVFLGRPRWLSTRATTLFAEPPAGRRSLVLSGYGDADPAEMLGAFPQADDRVELARLHARHIPPGDPRFPAWLALLSAEDRAALLGERLTREPAFMTLALKDFLRPAPPPAADEAAEADMLRLLEGGPPEAGL